MDTAFTPGPLWTWSSSSPSSSIINQKKTNINTLTNKKHVYTYKPKKTTNTYIYHNKKTTTPLNRDTKTNLNPIKNILPNHPQT
jgi:hypothetical protein